MLCSKCSEQIRPIVAIDIDGTIADYHGHFARFAEAWLDRSRPEGRVSYNGGEPYRHWFCREYSVDLTTFRTIKLAYRQGGQKRLMPLIDAHGLGILLSRIDELGAELWLTTTRPWDRYDRVDPDTREWLRRHKIHPYAILSHEAKLDELAASVGTKRVVAVLDDEPLQCQRALDLFPQVRSMMMMTEYNRAANCSSAVKLMPSHFAVAREITNAVTTWKAAWDNS